MLFLKRLLKYFLYVISSVALLIAGFVVYLVWFQPPFYFPKPTGAYAVGMRQYHWIDTTRKETRTNDPAHPYRELMVKAWYPTSLKELRRTGPTQKQQQNGAQVTPYAPSVIDFEKKSMSKIMILSEGRYRPIYAYYEPNAVLAHSKKPFPIIIFTHGFGVPDDLYTAYFTELASAGYVVFSINHTYDCQFVDFPDGRRVLMSPFPEKMSYHDQQAFTDKNIETWIADACFVLNQIAHEAHTVSSMFYQKLDLEHIGIFGHSFGGAAAVQCCRRDKRFIAGCDLDGPLYGVEFAKPFKKPMMFIHAQQYMWKQIIDDINKKAKPEECKWAKKWFEERYISGINNLVAAIGHDAYNIDFLHAEHMTFSDLAIIKHASLCPRMFSYFGAGSLDGFKATEIINAYLVNFFDKYLKGKPSELLDEKNENYEEVTRRQ